MMDAELAVHCHARGWTELAAKILDQKSQPDQPLLEAALADTAWGYWLGELQKPATDRAKIARLLKIVSEHRVGPFAKYDGRILDAIDRSLLPGKGTPGTVEALIDALIDVTDTDQTRRFGGGQDVSPAYMKVARLGFDAVPALIAHLDDERLTRAYEHGFNNFRGYHYMVGDVCCDLLQGIAGEELGKDWLRRLQGYRLDKEAVEGWWADAQKVGEEAYFVKHVLGVNDEQGGVNRLMLDVLAHTSSKYDLPDSAYPDFPKIEVRNCAAVRLARLLDLTGLFSPCPSL
jgi:hypothetical protein